MPGQNPSKIKSQEPSQTQSSALELDQLRNIVFGAAKTDLEAQINKMRSDMQANFQSIAKSQQQQIEKMQAALEDNVNKLDERITEVDNTYENKTSQLTDDTNQLTTELETIDINSRQQDDEIRKKLEDETEQLTTYFTKQHHQTIELLNQVKKDLNSSKTDRKTLAKLLATVVSNLENDEDS
ncbi:MAG: hypothetical protein HRU06_15285 [Oceanospirillaceae bacterium]|nr:hypothetical protein [Oceanospirillaceae bacterium]